MSITTYVAAATLILFISQNSMTHSNFVLYDLKMGEAVASWLVRSSSDQAVQIQVGDIVLCSLARHFTLTVPLSTQVYKWIPANLMLDETVRWTSIPSRGE